MSSPATESHVEPGDSRRLATSLATLFRANEMVLFLVVLLMLLIGFAINPRFLALNNLQLISRDTAVLAIAAIGVCFPILTGGIDLSIGSMVGLGGILVALFIQNWG